MGEVRDARDHRDGEECWVDDQTDGAERHHHPTLGLVEKQGDNTRILEDDLGGMLREGDQSVVEQEDPELHGFQDDQAILVLLHEHGEIREVDRACADHDHERHEEGPRRCVKHCPHHRELVQEDHRFDRICHQDVRIAIKQLVLVNGHGMLPVLLAGHRGHELGPPRIAPIENIGILVVLRLVHQQNPKFSIFVVEILLLWAVILLVLLLIPGRALVDELLD
mmetsp:Transcript_102040/g.327422  ORF Transcript_102040/g.327422 Transcript_102040/m.327422 type:complete len:223 (-) Transcript_102040:14-682(-)